MTDPNRRLLALSAQIVAAHAGHNPVGSQALPGMIRNVYQTLADLSPADLRPKVVVDPIHAVHDHHQHDHDVSAVHRSDPYVHPIHGQTVFRDYLICMEDGLTMKMLKRHLLTVHGMTPDQYRAKWNLPDDYPMVASNYAKLRSSLALQSGLGLKPADRPSKGRKGRKS